MFPMPPFPSFIISSQVPFAEKVLTNLDPWSGTAWGVLLLAIMAIIYILFSLVSFARSLEKKMVTREDVQKEFAALKVDIAKDIKLAVQEVNASRVEDLDARFREFFTRDELLSRFESRDAAYKDLQRRFDRLEEKHERLLGGRRAPPGGERDD